MNCNNSRKRTYQTPILEAIPVLVKAQTTVSGSGADLEIENMKDGGTWSR